MLPVVAIVGAPGFIIYHCIWIKLELKQAEQEQANKFNEESAKKQLNLELSAVHSSR